MTSTPTSTRGRGAHPLATRAAILTESEQFRRFVAHRVSVHLDPVTPTAAAEYLRHFCRIESRRDLDTTPDAARLFAILQTEFDAWRGKIARPR